MYLVIYDGNCNLCVTLVQLLEKLDGGDRFSYVPMQDEPTLSRFEVTAADCELGMILIELDEDGNAIHRRWQGSAAAEEIGHLLPMGQVFVNAYRALPGAKLAGDKAYEFIRDNRYQLFGQRSETYQPAYPCADGRCSGASAVPSPVAESIADTNADPQVE
ncbi:MAG: DCC1-like thiol-disulfide oxidoreductase family protein [Cyanobacteria bacterium P01_D01_bin.105]